MREKIISEKIITDMSQNMKTVTVDFHSNHESVAIGLDMINARGILAKQRDILIKPNLVNDSKHPVTTSPDFCDAVIDYVRACSKADIIIAEGCGEQSLETHQIFNKLGYTDLAKRKNVELVDLNNAELVKLEDKNCPYFPEMYLPKIAFSHFIISLPVLKAHSLAVITGTMKNMVGFAPPKYYEGKFGVWKKAVFHGTMHQAIIDLNKYRTPDLSIMDASIGLKDHHLRGRHCDPPIKKVIAGFDSLQVDREAANLLGIDWREISHLG